MGDRENLSANLRLLLLSTSLAVGAGLLWAASLRDVEGLPGAPVHLPWWLLTLAFVISESVPLHLETRGEAHAITLSEPIFVAGLILSTPTDLVVARVLSGIIVLGLVRRQSLSKLCFNLALFAAESCLAAWVYLALLGDHSPTSVAGWPALFVSLLAVHLFDSITVTAAIAIFNGRPKADVVRQLFLFGAAVSMASAGLGLALVGSIWDKSSYGVLVGVVVVGLFFLYRAYTKLTERHRDLGTLHAFTRSLGGSDIEELERAAVLGAREILRGEQAALLLPPILSGSLATKVLARGNAVVRTEISADQLDRDLRLLLPSDRPRLYRLGDPLPGWLAEIGVKDAVVVPLAADGRVAGAMVVANRLTEVSSFVEEDLQLFETLANHANVALANGRLVATLQHDAQEKAYQALHDPVTDLPNRSSLEESLREALAEAHRNEMRVGLLFVDLDTFKDVNDTLGIATGDAVLREVRQRLEPLLPDRSILTRFTGDQFAIMVRGVQDPVEVEGLAEMIDAEFDQPFVLGEASVVLAASIGVALFPDHATTADALMQRADAATYVARKEGSGIEVYAPENDPQSQRRLSLAADLRVALEEGEVDVYLQPKLSIVDQMVVGAEALVRWPHPRLGFLYPDEFIGAAEQTGVIRPLTHYVVQEALRQCRAWRDAGLDLGISVNLSVKNLFEPRLAEDIAGAIEEAGVPASCLTLEITESTVMESKRSLDVLSSLDALGLNLSVDDFGTGYSSLTYLRRLPVNELKIDKSFVMTMTTNDQDAVIVRTLVELGRSLGLKTVAEGVESPDAVEMLREYGCVEAQGYYFSRPIPADQFTSWLGRQRVRPLDGAVVSFERERERRVVGEAPRV